MNQIKRIIIGILAVTILPIAASASSQHTLSNETVHPAIAEDMVEAINVLRERHGLAPLTHRQPNAEWTNYYSCMADRNKTDYEVNGLQMNGHNEDYFCTPATDGYAHPEVFGLVGDGRIPVKMAKGWYFSDGHRASMFSNADYVMVDVRHYIRDDGTVVTMALAHFGRTDGASSAKNHSTEADVAVLSEMNDETNAFYSHNFHGVDQNLQLVAPGSVPSSGGNSGASTNWTTNPTIANATSLDEIVNSNDYNTEVHPDILRLYRAYFNREPDVGGAKYWLEVSKNRSLSQIAAYFSGSDEFVANYSGVNDETYLTRVYANILGRKYDQGGFDYWIDVLKGTNCSGNNPEHSISDKSKVVLFVGVSPEFTSRFPYLPGVENSSDNGYVPTETGSQTC